MGRVCAPAPLCVPLRGCEVTVPPRSRSGARCIQDPYAADSGA